jgi:AraC-like DNA-binding protein
MCPMTGHIFWRDDALPFIEARSVQDGRGVCYAPHSHATFSIGAILDGRCTYTNRDKHEQVGAGTIVLMNPGDVHACNSIRDEPWAYRMLYWDTAWVTRVQQEISRGDDGFQRFAVTATRNVRLFRALNRLYETLVDPQADHLQKHESAFNFMSDVQRTLGRSASAAGVHGRLPQVTTAQERLSIRSHARVARAAEFIRQNCTRPLKLTEICSVAELSASYLIRAFKAEYGMSPHAYLINCRIEFSRQQLRRGRPLAEVAVAAGFCDQAHLQRSFKKFVAVTPGQYQN